jgi:hypothetical protein
MCDFGETLLAKLHTVDSAMVQSGSHPISPRWWEALERFYQSSKRTLAIRKGRQVYASKGIFPRLAVATLLVPRHVPRGEVRSIACLSVRRSEAADRLLNVSGVLDVLRIPYSTAGDTLQIPELQARIVVLTASYKTAVGDSCDLVWADELTRWADDMTSSNPAEHVIGSVKPSLVTLENSRLFLVSSPWVDGDFHSKQIDRGDTEDQNVEVFTTWEAAPHLTEADCRKMASNESEFNREYGAQPDDGASTPYFDPDSIDRSFTPSVHLDSELHPEFYAPLHELFTILH